MPTHSRRSRAQHAWLTPIRSLDDEETTDDPDEEDGSGEEISPSEIGEEILKHPAHFRADD